VPAPRLLHLNLESAQWDRTYMIVSEVALDILRSNNVVHAEADEITVPLAEYFDSPRKYFWMQDERIRQYFIDMDNRRKKQMPDGQER
jgi:hypothetical protein